MRKKIIGLDTQSNLPADRKWLNLKQLAQVEITSEEVAYPIEDALDPNEHACWRASKAGKQTIRFIFDEPQHISLIHLLFKEEEQARTQEFVLRWARDKEQTYQEIVRQQYNFSPGSATQQQEDYSLNLEGVKVLELVITPDVSGGNIHASMSRFLIA